MKEDCRPNYPPEWNSRVCRPGSVACLSAAKRVPKGSADGV